MAGVDDHHAAVAESMRYVRRYPDELPELARLLPGITTRVLGQRGPNRRERLHALRRALASSSVNSRAPPLSAWRIRTPSTVRTLSAGIVVIGMAASSVAGRALAPMGTLVE
jgi:hypothetical protein